MAGTEEMQGYPAIPSEIMTADTLAMDSMDLYPEGNPTFEAAPGFVGDIQEEEIHSDSEGDGGAHPSMHDEDEMDDPAGMDTMETEILSRGEGEAETEEEFHEGLAVDPGSPQEEAPLDVYDQDETEFMDADATETEVEEVLVVGQGDKRKGVKGGKKVASGGKAKKVSAYFRFANQNREAVKVEMAAAGQPTTASAIAKILGERWRALTDIEKQSYNNGHDDAESEKQGQDMDSHEEDGGGNMEEVMADEEEGDKIAVEFVAPFPITRVKRIIKLDRDIKLVSSDGITLITQAAALFVEKLASASFRVMVQHKRKSIRGPDVVLAAKSSRKFRECLGNDLATLLEESDNEDEGDDAADGEDNATEGEHVAKKPQRQKSAKKQNLLPPPGSRPITNFFKA